MTSPPAKRICVCCDGTWNDSSDANKPPTNVTKIARSIKQDGNKDGQWIQQVIYYQAGVGTQGGMLANLYDGATGRGISENIREAYGFICQNYNHGDDIFLIGFSRGAFTARAISSLIYDIGLLTKAGLGYFYDIFMAWEKQNENAKEKDADAASVTLSEFQNKIKSISRPNIPIKAVAVWDTVGELGIPIDGVSNAYSFVNTKVSPNIEYAFQALALEEHRKPFRPTVWEQPDGQELPRVLKQCWFTGYHSLVGGGNTDNNEIPNIALAWMIAQLKDLLEFDILLIKANNDMRQVAARHDLQGEASPRESHIWDSFKGFYLLAGSQTRTPGRYHFVNPSTMKETDRLLRNTNETIHISVRRRFIDQKSHALDAVKDYYPNALKEWTFEQAASGKPAQWLFQGKSDEATPPSPLLEQEVSDFEAEVLKSWATSGSAVEDFDLQASTW